ncbi:MAG: ABC transporter permease [Treponema sp.]|nr:ABC transporter permease [Treponema sp.]
MKNRWVLFVASRYISKGRSNSPILAVLGIAFGVLALIVIIAVMNGFQLGFIESIVEISSYHLRLDSVPPDKVVQAQETVLQVPGVKAAVPFREFQALARGRRSGQQAVAVRGVPQNALETDKLMSAKLEFEDGSFDISGHDSVLLGTELARRLGLGVGDYVTMFSISGILSAEDESGLDEFTITGIFRTGFYEYDCSWAFINIENDSFLADDSGIKLGVKITNRFQDRVVLDRVKKKFLQTDGFEDVKFSSWRDYNRSFFGALRTEKLFMFILVGLIFIVVGLNIFQSQRRVVLQRREEIGLLRAIGGNERAVRFVFVCDGAIIGLTGASAGLIFGLVIASNIPQFFSLIESIVNAFIGLLNILAGFFGAGQAENFAVFSPAIFYIKEIPSRILPMEVILIFMFGFLSALAAAWFASRKAAKIQPAEVLRYE